MYEKNVFQFLLFIVCIGNKCADNVGRMSTEDAGKLSVGTSVWSGGETKEYNLENAAKGYLPQFALSAKASYQSEVTEIPVKLPGVDLKGLPKDQYQVMLELQQKIWDGGGIRMQKKQTTAEAEIEKEKLNVDMYALNSRVNDLYFEFFCWTNN